MAVRSLQPFRRPVRESFPPQGETARHAPQAVSKARTLGRPSSNDHRRGSAVAAILISIGFLPGIGAYWIGGVIAKSLLRPMEPSGLLKIYMASCVIVASSISMFSVLLSTGASNHNNQIALGLIIISFLEITLGMTFGILIKMQLELDET